MAALLEYRKEIISAMGDASTRKDEDSEELRVTPQSKDLETSSATHTLQCAVDYPIKGCVCGAEKHTYSGIEKAALEYAESRLKVRVHANDREKNEDRFAIAHEAYNAISHYISTTKPVSVDLSEAIIELHKLGGDGLPADGCKKCETLAKTCAKAWGLSYVN